MKISDILNELTFHGRRCTKDCGGHSAGYRYAMQRKKTQPCNSHSPSFNGGCEVAADQLTTGKVIRPKVRDPRGKFAVNPRLR
jgi:hypothetical protein